MASNVESAFAKHIEKPKRIQRKRVHGWRMPENAVYVGRPTQWGNPYRISDFPEKMLDDILHYYRYWIEQQLQQDPTFLDPLKGKDLACWCPLSKPCHADILLEYLEVS